MIRLVTISRISKEKGFERMLKLEKLLIASGVPYLWDCYGDTTTAYAKRVIPHFKSVKFRGVTNEPLKIVKEYDYLVQLSDTEGFPYSIYEAMQQKVPVIATDFPSIREMITDGVNGYILNMDLSSFDVDKIKDIPQITTFKEKSTEKDWINFIDMRKTRRASATTTGTTPETKVSAIVTRKYHDTVLGKIMERGQKLKVTPERLTELEKAEVAKAGK